jgi:Secretion system C-terminal sorting domain
MKLSIITKQTVILLLSFFSFQLNAQTDISLPVADEWKSMSKMPAIAGDGFTINFTGNVAVNSEAPVVGEWNRTAKPNETITLSGARFTLRTGVNAGSDTRVYLYAQTSSGGVLKPCKVLYITDLLMTVTLPENIPFGLYFIWIKNEKGVSSPITVNKSIAEWIGPLGTTAQPGAKKRIFGKNLSFNRGEASSKVYIQSAGGGALTQCTVTKVEPYSVEFEVPQNLSNGNYKVYAHSGHGGEYGWSKGLDLTIAPKWERGTTVVTVLPGENIQSAIDQITASANGGTVKLMNGLHTMTVPLVLKSMVNLEGESKENTILQLPRITPTNSVNNQFISIQNLTVRPAANGECRIVSQSTTGGDRNRDLLLKNVNFKVHPYPADSISKIATFFEVERFEVTECEFDAKLNFYGKDVWIYNNRFNGERGGKDGAIAYIDGNNMPSPGGIIVENNDAGTRNWPNKNGNRNYTQFLASGPISRIVWCSRLMYFQVLNLSVENIYIARNKTTDTAIQDNKGEQVLFHSNWGPFVQVDKSTERTIEIRTDGKVYGSAVAFNPEIIPTQPVTAFKTVPEKFQAGVGIDDRAYLVILNGKGKGQYSKVESHTSTTITVKDQWRVQPDSTSIVLLTYTTMNATVFKNEFNGFPIGYKDIGAAASYGVSTESAINTAIEGNITNRTMYGYSIQGYDLAPSFWNVNRNNISNSTFRNGSRIVARTGDWGKTSIRAISPILLGSWLRNDESESSGGSDLIGLGRGDSPSNLSLIQGSGIEGSVFKNGITVAGNSEGLIHRNNSMSGTSATLKKYSNAIFSNNGTGTFSASTNLYKDKIIPEYRALDIYTDNVDAEFEVPILNGGVNSWTFSVLSASQPWIIASVKDGTSSIEKESNSGIVLVRIDKSKLPPGDQFGVITLTNANGLQNTIGIFYNETYPLSLTDNMLNELVSVYPNPFSNQLTLKGNGIEGYSLYAMSGQLLISQKTSDELISIDAQNLTRGTYVIKIETAEGIVYKKVIKQ